MGFLPRRVTAERIDVNTNRGPKPACGRRWFSPTLIRVADLDDVTRRLAAAVPELLTEHGVPGAAIGVTDASGLRWSQTFGTAGRGRPVTARTMFSLQSVSKLYTATTVMLAVQDGLIDLDVPIPTYVPGFTVNSVWESHPEREITLRHLAAVPGRASLRVLQPGRRSGRVRRAARHGRAVPRLRSPAAPRAARARPDDVRPARDLGGTGSRDRP
ncbi:hypothetical protein GCM10027569_53090 [Flindersiella endophytica]